MKDKEIQIEILKILREKYNRDPHGRTVKEEILSELNALEIEIDRTVTYLNDKGLIDIEGGVGGIFYAKINSYGIDWLNKSIEVMKETEGYVLRHIFDETKEFVDAKLGEICPDILEKLNLCYKDLLSNSHHSGSERIAYDCREVLIDFTDAIFNENYLKNEEIKPSRNQTINKLHYTLRAIKIESKTERKLLETQIEYLLKYFANLSDFIQKNTHPDGFVVTNEDANRCVIYTYLVIADVLKLLDKNDNLEQFQEV